MEKEKLLQYLQACIDAEDAVYESDRLLAILDQEYRDFDRKTYVDPLPKLPGEPRPEPPMKDRRQDAQNTLTRHERDHRDALLNLNFKKARELKTTIENDRERYRQAEYEYEHRNELEQARIARYEKAFNEWNDNNKSYQFAIQCEGQKVISAIVREKKQQEELSAHFKEVREKLYETGNLHPDFRNIDALYQLSKYVDMGIAESLEGPNGAYRFYMDDLRTGKILDSISGLRKTVENGFSMLAAGQKAIYGQMVQMNSSLQEIDQGMRSHFQKLYDQIAETGQALSKTITEKSAYEQAVMLQIRQNQSEIGDIIAKSAYNQYLVSKKDNLDNYLVYMLSNPLL